MLVTALSALRTFFLREREGMGAHLGGVEGETISSRLHAHCGAPHEAQFHNPEIITLAEIKSLMLNQVGPPRRPIVLTNFMWITTMT